MKSNYKKDLSKKMIAAGISDDVGQIREYLIQLQKDVIEKTKSANLLDEDDRSRFDSIVKTLKYTIPSADSDSHMRWAADMANNVSEQRRAMYKELFESKENYEKGTGHKLRPISKEEKKSIMEKRRGKKLKTAPVKKR